VKTAASQSLIRLDLSTKDLTLQPNTPALLKIEVVNQSDRFASFQVELTAAGKNDAAAHWYTLSPEVSSKKPSGDRTEFWVKITDSPIPGFNGLINLTVRVFSLELRTEERQVLRLMVEQAVGMPLQVKLIHSAIATLPGEIVEIPVEVQNCSPHSVNIPISLIGQPDWLTNGETQTVALLPQQTAPVIITCQVPPDAPAHSYPFRVEATAPNGLVASDRANLTVQPIGTLQITCPHPEQRIPQKRAWLPGKQMGSASYDLQVVNHTNQPQTVDINWLEPDANAPHHRCQLAIDPLQTQLPVEDSTELSLIATVRRPWLGLPKILPLQLNVVLPDSDRPCEFNRERVGDDDEQWLILKVFPRIPRWLQALLILLLTMGLGWLSHRLLQGQHHESIVNSVQLNGLADQVISGSNDQTVRRWQVQGDRVVPMGSPLRFEKAVRRVQFRPLQNNILAAGLENGEIQLWNLLSKPDRPLHIYSNQPDDRVLALRFTNDAQSLFSGHGSGRVLQWALNNTAPDAAPLRQHAFDFAVYDLALVGADQQTLAIAGRYNQLVLWHWTTGNKPDEHRIQTIDYPIGGQDDYITSLAVADQSPWLMATGDTQGRLTLWDLRPCIDGTDVCKRLDQWNNGHQGKPVRSVAISPNACYLASTGEDGRVMLWSLASTGKRDGMAIAGKVAFQNQTALNSVDVQTNQSDVLVISGSQDHQVRLHRFPQPTDCQ
jgi:WD domain, G-beta repeat